MERQVVVGDAILENRIMKAMRLLVMRRVRLRPQEWLCKGKDKISSDVAFCRSLP